MMRSRWIPAALVAAAFIFSLSVYPQLPERFATHWGADGRPNGYSGRTFGAFFVPVLMLGIWAILTWVPRIDPRAANIQKFRDSYDLVVSATLGFMTLVHGAMLGSALGWPVSVDRIVVIGVGLLLLVIGNVLPRARSNFMFGIRTPWTLSDEGVWTRSHRVGGYLLSAAGLAMIAAAFLRPPWNMVLIVGSILVASLGSIGYSYVTWARGRRS